MTNDRLPRIQTVFWIDFKGLALVTAHSLAWITRIQAWSGISDFDAQMFGRLPLNKLRENPISFEDLVLKNEVLGAGHRRQTPFSDLLRRSKAPPDRQFVICHL
jgi:hypothetical protein